MKLIPYLSFNGECAEAFRFYEKALNGKITFSMTYGESPMAAQTLPEQQKRIMHTTLAAGDSIIHGADAPPNFYSKPQGFSIAISISSVEEAERVFAAISEGGDIKMPMQKTFWAERFGFVVDRYGTPWMINCEKPA